MNTFKIYSDWGQGLLIDTPLTATSKTNLDFSNLPTTTDLTIKISPPDKSHSQAANKVYVTDGSNYLVAYHVFEIKGGTGKNTYAFIDGGVLAGKLDDTVGENVLDYSQNDVLSIVNLKETEETVTPEITVKRVQAGVTTAADEE